LGFLWDFFGVAMMNVKLPAVLPAALLATSLAMGLMPTHSHAEGSATAGQTKAATCAACHGVDGNSANPEWPSLAGQHSQYIIKQLKAFKGGTRKNDTMAPMAMGLSDQDMEDVAAYFSSQTLHGLEADKSKVALGQKLYRGGNASTKTAACIACHGPNGGGNPTAGYPTIRGQHSVYLIAQLNAYKSGTRTTDIINNRMMHDVATTLSADEIAAVASYVQGLR
jgi:cytochrome c553